MQCGPACASLMLQNGESVTYVKEQMGHHSIQITVIPMSI
jgi:integrase